MSSKSEGFVIPDESEQDVELRELKEISAELLEALAAYMNDGRGMSYSNPKYEFALKAIQKAEKLKKS